MGVSAGPKIVTKNLQMFYDRAQDVASGISVGVESIGKRQVTQSGVDVSSLAGGELSFGLGDWVTIARSSSDDLGDIFGGGLSFTLEGWIYIQGFENYGTLIQNSAGGYYSDATAGIWITDITGSQIVFVLGTANSNSNNYGSVIRLPATNGPYDTNKLYHIVATADSSVNEVKLYINGSVHASGGITDDSGDSIGKLTLTRVKNSNAIAIGERSATSSGHLQGLVGYVAAYDRPLTHNEVLQNYNTFQPRYQNGLDNYFASLGG